MEVSFPQYNKTIYFRSYVFFRGVHGKGNTEKNYICCKYIMPDFAMLNEMLNFESFKRWHKRDFPVVNCVLVMDRRLLFEDYLFT